MAILSSGSAKSHSAHWYTREGLPQHTQLTADGTRDRATTIKDARKLNLLPSVTSYLGLLDKPALMDWKLNQALTAADSNPRQKDETLDYWVARIKDAAHDQVVEAADKGSEIHKALEECTAGAPVPPDLEPYVRPFLNWLTEKGLQQTGREVRIVSGKYGYAGTTDCLFSFGASGKGIIDYKSKKTKPGQKVDSYPEHKMQLAAYAAAHYGEDALGDVLAANVFISTTEPGRMEVIKAGDLRPWFSAFCCLCEVWRLIKGYDPRF
jgi:hypothetical protein